MNYTTLLNTCIVTILKRFSVHIIHICLNTARGHGFESCWMLANFLLLLLSFPSLTEVP